MDDVVEGDDVGVLELLEQRRLPDGRERRPLLLLQADLLQSHNLVGQAGKQTNEQMYTLLVCLFPRSMAVGTCFNVKKRVSSEQF